MTQCLLSFNNISNEGYARVFVDGKLKQAHRHRFEQYYGIVLDPDILICHTCDIRNCVEISHLFAGTAQDNMTDKTNKKRNNGPAGIRNHHAKLNEVKVQKMRDLYFNSHLQQQDIAAMFNISKGAACLAINRKTWRHVN